MIFYNFFRISKASEEKVPAEDVSKVYKSMRTKTFWGATSAYSLFYVCRMALSVVKQPVIDSEFLTPGQLGVIGSAFLFVYAFGKFMNGFIADYCNIKRFMATGIFISAIINLILGVLGLLNDLLPFSSMMIFFSFAILWGFNGWVQSMGSPPGIISLSRWFPLSIRGTFYSIFCATPLLGRFLSLIVTGWIVGKLGWEYGFIFSALGGFIASIIILVFVHDTPESNGLPSVQELSGEEVKKKDKLPTKELQKYVIKHPGIWIIALSSAFVYITQYAVAGWGVLFLQKAKGFTLEEASQVIAISSVFGVVGTVTAGWLSDKVFNGDRLKPVIIAGLVSFTFLSIFLFTDGGYIINIIYASIFTLAICALYCISVGLMALDIVPRKATGAAMGVIGIISYFAAGFQDVVSGYLIQGHTAEEVSQTVSEAVSETVAEADLIYNFTPVSIFWIGACLLSFLLPVINWRRLSKKSEREINKFA